MEKKPCYTVFPVTVMEVTAKRAFFFILWRYERKKNGVGAFSFSFFRSYLHKMKKRRPPHSVPALKRPNKRRDIS